MFPLNMPPYRVVASEGARAVRTRDADALMSLSNVSSQVGLVAVGAFAKRTPQLGARSGNGIAIIRVTHWHGKAHVIAGRQACGERDSLMLLLLMVLLFQSVVP